MKTTSVKTKFAGLVWVHERYITDLKAGGSLLIKHDGQEMTVTPERFKEVPPKKGEESFVEQYGANRGKRYFLYGFRFIPDGDDVIKPVKKKQAPEARGLISQCPDCLICSISTLQNKKEKIIMQHSIGEFPKIPKVQCFSCKKKGKEGATIK